MVRRVLPVPPNKRVTVIIEDLGDRNDTQKYVFPNVEGFEITTFHDQMYPSDNLRFSFGGTAWIDGDDRYAYVHHTQTAETF